MLTKLIPVLIVSGGLYKNQDKFKKILDFYTIAGVQIEMSNICKVIQLDSIDGEAPSDDPARFAEFIRQNIKSQNGSGNRDFSKDMWGSSYKLELKKRVATVVSAGPDKKFGTEDDIRASTDLF